MTINEDFKFDINKIPLFEKTKDQVFFDRTLMDDYEAGSFDDFVLQNQVSLEALSLVLNKNLPQSICLEGGHIYSDEIIETRHLQSLSGLKYLKEWLLEKGLNVSVMLFVDDIHPDPGAQVFELDTYRLLAQEFSLDFDFVVSEKEMSLLSQKLAGILESMKQTLINPEKGLFLNARNKPSLIDTHGMASCSLLDATLSLIKKDYFDLTINLLPPEYKTQQIYMTRILKAADIKTDEFIFSFLLEGTS